MKRGQCFQIPEGPIDIECLWREAQSLKTGRMPPWLDAEHADGYRYLGTASWAGLPPREKQTYFAEIEELEAASLIADEDPEDPCIHHLYIRAESDYDIWSIGIYSGTTPYSFAPTSSVRNPVITREDVSDVPAVLVADPFMIRADGTWFMFFEVLNWRTRKGEIGLAVSDDGRDWTYQHVVLAEPFHLSYPYVFERAGDHYMIPESYQAGSVRLYKATRFPTEWSFVGAMLEAPYIVDASVFQHDGTWWLFAETNLDTKHDTLRLYYSSDLRGPWHEHPGSPVIEGDPHIARPAGRVVVAGDQIVRYAQDCHPLYGTEVRAFDITELTTTHYCEREVDGGPVLGPSGNGWNACGMHHIDAHARDDGGWIACVDGWFSPGDR